ncbi:MAG: UDP-4-amino-4,6-dideoxy-N-acetyl-beta-L-altrosamine N-acetyltransferase [Candidatus Methanoperedenaceae archaeon]|nr:MAG: UDP-4-amino-4,6-dideoxy-N-acetyl-beta-L-altrosamine N-acetyltransferase [Candidatus Methanoperedenaceae archaeon]
METIDLKKNIELKYAELINFINLNDDEKEMIRNWRNHENVRNMMYSDHIITIEEHSKFIAGLRNDIKNSFWIVRRNRENIGVISLNRVDLKNSNAYIGIYTNPYLSGMGGLLIECLKKLAFDKVKLHTLKLEVIEENERAIHFYKKAGFEEEGRLREFVFKTGKWLDVIVMGILG